MGKRTNPANHYGKKNKNDISKNLQRCTQNPWEVLQALPMWFFCMAPILYIKYTTLGKTFILKLSKLSPQYLIQCVQKNYICG